MQVWVYQSRRYIRGLRSQAKRDYARAYLAYVAGRHGVEPNRGELSDMAAQAVRLTIFGYFYGHPELAR